MGGSTSKVLPSPNLERPFWVWAPSAHECTCIPNLSVDWDEEMETSNCRLNVNEVGAPPFPRREFSMNFLGLPYSLTREVCGGTAAGVLMPLLAPLTIAWAVLLLLGFPAFSLGVFVSVFIGLIFRLMFIVCPDEVGLCCKLFPGFPVTSSSAPAFFSPALRQPPPAPTPLPLDSSFEHVTVSHQRLRLNVDEHTLLYPGEVLRGVLEADTWSPLLEGCTITLVCVERLDVEFETKVESRSGRTTTTTTSTSRHEKEDVIHAVVTARQYLPQAGLRGAIAFEVQVPDGCPPTFSHVQLDGDESDGSLGHAHIQYEVTVVLASGMTLLRTAVRVASSTTPPASFASPARFTSVPAFLRSGNMCWAEYILLETLLDMPHSVVLRPSARAPGQCYISLGVRGVGHRQLKPTKVKVKCVIDAPTVQLSDEFRRNHSEHEHHIKARTLQTRTLVKVHLNGEYGWPKLPATVATEGEAVAPFHLRLNLHDGDDWHHLAPSMTTKHFTVNYFMTITFAVEKGASSVKQKMRMPLWVTDNPGLIPRGDNSGGGAANPLLNMPSFVGKPKAAAAPSSPAADAKVQTGQKSGKSAGELVVNPVFAAARSVGVPKDEEDPSSPKPDGAWAVDPATKSLRQLAAGWRVVSDESETWYSRDNGAELSWVPVWATAAAAT